MKTLSFIITVVLTLLISLNVFAQNWQDSCNDIGEEFHYKGLVQRGGLHITSEGTIRALVVFVQFKGDEFEPNNPN